MVFLALFESKVAQTAISLPLTRCNVFLFFSQGSILSPFLGQKHQILKSYCDTAPYYISSRPRIFFSDRSPLWASRLFPSRPTVISACRHLHLASCCGAQSKRCAGHAGWTILRAARSITRFGAYNNQSQHSNPQWLSLPCPALCRRRGGMYPMTSTPARSRQNHNPWSSRRLMCQIQMQAHL